MDEIGADSVRPMHVSPPSRAWIVLKEHVVLAAEESRCAGIVHPVGPGQQVELRTQGIAHKFFP
jgi:hypothetical protein